MGGEKWVDSWLVAHIAGSPPHGRGKDVLDEKGVQDKGITPAWAGKRL